MKLDRNDKGIGKYALVNMRKITALSPEQRENVDEALKELEHAGVLEYGKVGECDEFFVIKLRDAFAFGGLTGYAIAASIKDKELAEEIEHLTARSGPFSPYCKDPD